MREDSDHLRKPQRIFTRETLESRSIVASPVVVEILSVVVSAGESSRIAGGVAHNGRFAKRLVRERRAYGGDWTSSVSPAGHVQIYDIDLIGR
jgi:hypothetical protein